MNARTPFEDGITDRLNALAEHAPDQPRRPIDLTSNERARWQRYAAASALAVAAATGLLWLTTTASPPTEVTAGNTPTTETSQRPTETPTTASPTEDELEDVTLPDGWLAFDPPDGIAMPNGVMVWTGTEALIWGGQNDSVENTAAGEPGFAFNPESGQWRELPAGPKDGTFGAAAIWTGDELIICCGQNSTSATAYSPDTDSWRVLPNSPISSEFTEAVWTGAVMLVTTPAGVASYNPTDNEWSSTTTPPTDLGRLRQVAWSGTEMFIWPAEVARTLSQGLAYDPTNDSWRTLPDPPAWPAAPSIAWTGSHLMIWGALPAPTADDSERAVGSMYDPSTDSWTALPEALPEPDGCECNIGSRTMLWTGTHLVIDPGELGSGLNNQNPAALIRFDPTQQTWDLVGPSPATQLPYNAVHANGKILILTDTLYVTTSDWPITTTPLN